MEPAVNQSRCFNVVNVTVVFRQTIGAVVFQSNCWQKKRKKNYTMHVVQLQLVVFIKLSITITTVFEQTTSKVENVELRTQATAAARWNRPTIQFGNTWCHPFKVNEKCYCVNACECYSSRDLMEISFKYQLCLRVFLPKLIMRNSQIRHLLTFNKSSEID